MKKLLLLVLCICACPPPSFALTYEEFKHLSQAQRTAIFNNPDDPSYYDAAHWQMRVIFGEEAWHHEKQRSLALQNGYRAVIDLMVYYRFLREHYLNGKWAEENAVNPTAQSSRANARQAEVAEAGQPSATAIPLLSALVPSAEARALNLEAGRIYVQWFQRWPYEKGETWVITDADMSVVGQAVQGILEHLQKLPKLTPAQEQAALDALPEEQPMGK